jgi:1-acyl-sn-glycerol-3-phosphate acyltransferase
VKVEGLGKLLKSLEEKPSGSSGSGTGLLDEKEGEQAGRRGVVTICNHTSVVDDPMVSLCLGHFIPFCSERVASR